MTNIKKAYPIFLFGGSGEYCSKEFLRAHRRSVHYFRCMLLGIIPEIMFIVALKVCRGQQVLANFNCRGKRNWAQHQVKATGQDHFKTSKCIPVFLDSELNMPSHGRL